VTFRKFNEVVERLVGGGCGESPLGSDDMTVTNTDTGATCIVKYRDVDDIPRFRDLQVLAYTTVLTGVQRDILQRTAFELIYHPMQQFVVDNPIKYSVTKSNRYVDANDITIPLPFNGPIEELFWVIRRKSDIATNRWCDFAGLVLHARLLMNGSPVVDAEGDWFRSAIATVHNGGIHLYDKNIYGYSFALFPGQHMPSGSVNFSRSQSVELRLTVAAAGEGDNWEVLVYGIGINWLRFQNGMCGRVFSS
jgi:hypothetical protein